MLIELYNHRNGLRSVSVGDRMGVENLLDRIVVSEGRVSTIQIKADVRSELTALGWSDKIQIANGSKISITAVHGDVGLAMQFGNISRVYADMLKLQVLYIENKIAGGILLVPHEDLVKRLSKNGDSTDNRCSFDRLQRELPIFAKVITIPLIVYGLYTKGVNHE